MKIIITIILYSLTVVKKFFSTLHTHAESSSILPKAQNSGFFSVTK